MIRISILAAIALLAMAGSVSAAPASRNMVTQMLDIMPGTAVAYCSSRQPNLKSELVSEQAAFDARITAAAKPFLDKIRRQHPRDQGVPEAQITAIKNQILAQLTTVDASTYCLGLIGKFKTIDANAFMAHVKQAYSRYLTASRNRGHQPGG